MQHTSTGRGAAPLTARSDQGLAGRALLLGVAVLALGMVGAHVANAASIPVTNAGFEDPVLADGAFNFSVSGWVVEAGSAGTFNPTGYIPGGAAEGANTSYSNGSTISQTLGALLSEGTYTLTVEVGDRSDTAFPGYLVELGVDNGGFTPLAADSAQSPTDGFATSTLTYTATGADANLGNPLVIRLSGSGSQVNFDDVRLEFVPTPHDVDVYLQTQSFNKPLPDGGTAAMWGFALCTDNSFTTCVLPTDAPGPQIDAFEGHSLTIHLSNTLPTPASVLIPGQAGGGDPVFTAEARPRVRSFTHEAGDGGGTAVYTWPSSALRPGTYLYQSGTRPSIQVPMGLYGALVVHPAPGVACPSGQAAYGSVDSCYDADAVLLFSEIDAWQNWRVADAVAASLPLTSACVPMTEFVENDTTGYPCTVDYNPTYLLVNGAPSAPLPAGQPGDNVLLRFLNAGLRSHAPAIVGLDMGLVAEDGNPYPGLARRRSEALLPAGRTLDVIASPTTDMTFALFDRMPAFSLPDGATPATLVVGTGTPPPPPPAGHAVDDVYSVVEDSPLVGAASVLTNDVGLGGATVTLVSAPSNGTLECGGSPGLCPDGTFTYTPNPDFSGPDGFTYSASLAGNSYPAQVTLNVSFANDLPVAMDDGPYVNAIGPDINVAAPGVLGNDADPEGDTLTAWIDGPAPAGLTLNPDGSFEYTGASDTTFMYSASDDGGITFSAPAQVTLNYNPMANITLNVQDPAGTGVADYRWLVQEDATYHNDPEYPVPPLEQQALNFHRSYMPVVAQGCVGTMCDPDNEDVPEVDFSQVALDPAKHYYVSVLPSDAEEGTGYTIGGAQIPAPPGGGTFASPVTVIVNNQPIPTSQVAVLVFEDIQPTNGVPDPLEPRLGGFQITLEDAGGRYGISGGTMMQDAFGAPLRNALDCFDGASPPMGVILTCPDGTALIKDLPPGKYGVIAVPPAGPDTWIQTSTIEGTKVIDAWVEAGNPPLFSEFGVPSYHAFVGFVNPEHTTVPDGIPPGQRNNEVTGRVTLLHDARPPVMVSSDSGSYDGLAHTRAWVGLNSSAGAGPNIATVQADPDGHFTISGIPDGTHQLAIWDTYLDQIIAYRTVILPGGGDLGNIPVNAWFTRTEHNVFLDTNLNGILDGDEAPLPEQAVNLRWRDGTVNQSFPTDTEGFVPFDQTFPFFHWQVLEVDFTRFKPTGVTVTVDGGGDVSGGPYPGLLNPQDGSPSTEIGPVLTRAYQGFPGQTTIFEWGKAPYQPGENGGISGIVYYASTRGENDPRLTVGDPWEPGIPGVKVRLYREVATAGLSIAVNNAGFEDPVLADGAFNSSVSGWVIEAGYAGTFNPTGYIPGGAAEGANTSYSNGSTLSQTLAAVLEEGTYTLSVAVGDRTDTAFPGYQVQLGVMSGATFVLLAEDNSSLSSTDGFMTSEVTYTASEADANLGDPLVVRLIGDGEQVNFDDVRLTLGSTALALVQEVTTDSWDDSLPTDCPGEIAPGSGDPFVEATLGGDWTRCYDGWRNWNQVRPGVFDGGYAFTGRVDANGDPVLDEDGNQKPLPPGRYVVEVVPPPGYELVKEEDKNVDFGDAFTTASVALGGPAGMLLASLPDLAMVQAALAPEPGLAQPPCVGAPHLVPPQLSLFPGVDTWAPFAGAERPLCDRKEVLLSDQGQVAADFFLFTSTPVAAQFSGLITDDIATETNPAAPGYGEKWSPAYLPYSMRDFNGHEVYRGYSDAFGHFNGVLPSTFSANIPIPSGYSPNMILTCLNDPGDGATPDAFVNPSYGRACYTLQFMPGATTYLDTPMLPQAAFAAAFEPVDCAFPDGTPVVTQVDGAGVGPLVASGGTLTIHAQGPTDVPNPQYEGPLGATLPTISRDYGFGTTQGTGSVTVNGIPLTNVAWSDTTITGVLPISNAGTGELIVTRDNGKVSINTVTVTVGTETPIRVSEGESIQAAIDAPSTLPGTLILVGPGTFDELLVMSKPLRLQGSGAATIIDASKTPNSKLEDWRQKVRGLIDAGEVDLLPGQPTEFDLVGGGLFANELGAGITVLAKDCTGGPECFDTTDARIDGFTITNGDGGGAIFVNGYAHNLQISNNRITGNSGVIHGGIRVGHPFLPQTGDGPFGYNTNVSIHHNALTLNGGLSRDGAGGAVSLCTGTDNYSVSRNFVCGNSKLGDGAGIGHLGLSDNGLIEFNQILFNQSYSQGLTRSGGGILIAGEPAAVGGLTLGAGNVTIDSNLIQGNHAASGHGGGIRTQLVNGRDVELSPFQPGNWYQVRFTNNMIVNNVAGWSGGGMSLQDTVNSSIVLNTIAHNDSTATVGAVFDVATATSTRQPAGISSERNSLALDAVIPGSSPFRQFSNPWLTHNIVWQNRAFTYDGTTGTPRLLPALSPGGVGSCPNGADYFDLGVLDPGFSLNPLFSILTSTAGYPFTNSAQDPEFLSAYCNGARTLSAPGPMQVAAAGGEGGNFIDVRYGPLTQAWPVVPPGTPWNYHIASTSPAIDRVAFPPFGSNVDHDFDNQARPDGFWVDWGADEAVEGEEPPPPPPPAQGTVTYSPGAFGEVPVDTTAELTITATVSDLAVAFTSTAPPGPPFSITADTCVGNTVAVGGTCTFTVTFSPTSATTSNDSFTVTSDAAGSPHTVSLSGTGVATATLLYFSKGNDNPVPGVAPPFDDADIYTWDGTSFGRVFDASDAGLPGGANIDALLVVDADTFYMSFTGTVNLPGLGAVDDSDVVLYDAGAWSLFFDGSDVSLTTGGEDIDAFYILGPNSVVISTTGAVNAGVPGASDEDLLRCDGTFGPATTCTWSMYFDGSDVGLTANSEDVKGVSVSAGSIYLTTQGGFNAGGAISGQGRDVFACDAPTTGPASSCGGFSLFFDGSATGLSTGTLDAIDVP